MTPKPCESCSSIKLTKFRHVNRLFLPQCFRPTLNDINMCFFRKLHLKNVWIGMTLLNVINLRQQINQLNHCGHLCSMTSWPTVCVCSFAAQYSWLCPNKHKEHFCSCMWGKQWGRHPSSQTPPSTLIFTASEETQCSAFIFFTDLHFRVNYYAYHTSY